MKASVIIPIFNQRKYTQKCLESIFSSGSKYDFEIIVIDNASTDDSGEYLVGLGNKMVLIYNDKNLGFAKACNQGAKIARGEYLLFLNNDTVVTPNWLDIMIGELDSDRDAAIVGPKLLYPNDTIQQAGVVFKSNKQPYHIYNGEKGDEAYVNEKRRFQCLTAACFLVRSKVFRTVNGFDETYVNGYEDVDFCLKVGELGYGILYCPESVVYHYGSSSVGRHIFDNKNRKIFIKRWGGKIRVDYRDFLIKDGMGGYRRMIARVFRRLTGKNV